MDKKSTKLREMAPISHTRTRLTAICLPLRRAIAPSAIFSSCRDRHKLLRQFLADFDRFADLLRWRIVVMPVAAVSIISVNGYGEQWQGGPMLYYRCSSSVLHLGFRKLGPLKNSILPQPLNIVAILLFQQLREEAAEFFQLPVRSLFHNLTASDHDDFIDVSKRTQAVRNHNHRASDNQLIQSAHDFALGFHIHARGWLVQDEDGRVSQDGARDGDALALTEREIFSLLVNLGVIAAPVHNGLVNLRPFCCINNIFQARAGPTYFDVIAEGSLEQHHS